MLECRLRRSTRSTHTLLAELSELLEAPRHALGASPHLPATAYYEHLVRELDAVGWGALLSLSPALDELQLMVDDDAGRSHVLGLALPPDYPQSPPRATVAAAPPSRRRLAGDSTVELSESKRPDAAEASESDSSDEDDDDDDDEALLV